MIHSMTGFASRIVTLGGEKFRIEIKSLNHRFLEIKIRMPRDWLASEVQVRSWVQSKLKRGAVEIWIERHNDLSTAASVNANEYIDWNQASLAHDHLVKLSQKFSLDGPITVRDLLMFPEVLSQKQIQTTVHENESFSEDLKLGLLQTLDDLKIMRSTEGKKLQAVLLDVVKNMQASTAILMQSRQDLQLRSRERIKRKVEQCFESNTANDFDLQTRVAQEIALAFEKLDIEEELIRYQGHVQEIQQLLEQGDAVGKKLDFLLQELNREVNTLGNKSQDLGMSQQVIQLKMWVEQLREQCLNLE